jgi:hypothetical protein
MGDGIPRRYAAQHLSGITSPIATGDNGVKIADATEQDYQEGFWLLACPASMPNTLTMAV